MSASTTLEQSGQKDLSFKVFHELMLNKVKEILLVSSPYDAFIMEEDGRLAERIIHEYKGLNLSSPPVLTWVSSAEATIKALSSKKFDMIIAMPHISDMAPFELCRKIKKKYPALPIIFLAHDTADILFLMETDYRSYIDRIFVWMGNTDLLLALIKNSEDTLNVENDTEKAKVRVVIFVEDSPIYRSSLLSLLYKEIVMQTQAVMDGSINEEHRILRMRARPKILIAENFEEAEALYRKFASYLLCVISDVRFPRNGKTDDLAGFKLLSMIREERPELPLCMLSSETSNSLKASEIQAVFLNKNSLSLHADIRYFFIRNLGFGDFVFRLPNGMVLARASNLRTLGSILPSIPEKSVIYHASRNDFSTWLMARSEIKLAYELKDVKNSDFKDEKEIKKFLISVFKKKLIGRQKGQIADFVSDDFDSYSGFIKIGRGSLGGKARGLAFILTQLNENPEIQEKFSGIDICVPKSIVISTEGFDSFIDKNNLNEFSPDGLSDSEIEDIFLNAGFPSWLESDLKHILAKVTYPLAIRSSSLLEDGYYRPSAGAYNTFMIPNNHPDASVRLSHLISAIKLVYASTFLETPRTFAKSGYSRTGEDKMAIIIQQLGGNRYGDYFYPAISGVAQSYNYYPLSYMKPEEGIAFISLGLGKSVVEGYSSLRFSPKYPEFLPQFSSVDSILDLSQRYFFALDMKNFPETINHSDDLDLIKIEIDDAVDHHPIQFFSSTYYPDDHKIRDTFNSKGYPVLTFSRLLKHSHLSVPKILQEIMELGSRGMGCPVEIEFAIKLKSDLGAEPEFQLLQIRPMTLQHQVQDIEITEDDIKNAFCYSTNAMGRSQCIEIENIIYVKTDALDANRTIEIASEIGVLNAELERMGKKYILAGPGRWGSSDRFLGIPVGWKDISSVCCIIEAASSQLKADPSYGTHFFHNITSLGITYLTVSKNKKDFIDWDFLGQLEVVSETPFIRHVRTDKPLKIKMDGKKQCTAILKNQ